MEGKIKVVAFDLGGVLVQVNTDLLDNMELALYKAYMHRFDEEKVIKEAYFVNCRNIKSFLEEAEKRITEIYFKTHFLTKEGIKALNFIKEKNLDSAIWTNNIWALYDWLDALNIYEFVSKKNICNSISLGNGINNKPSMQFFALALLQMKRKENEILFIDDEEKNIIGARKSGIAAIRYNYNEKRNCDLSMILKNNLQGSDVKGDRIRK